MQKKEMLVLGISFMGLYALVHAVLHSYFIFTFFQYIAAFTAQSKYDYYFVRQCVLCAIPVFLYIAAVILIKQAKALADTLIINDQSIEKSDWEPFFSTAVRVLGIYGPASCHPTLVAFPEGHYLTAILLTVV